MKLARLIAIAAVFLTAIIVDAKRHIPAHCMRELNFSHADCRIKRSFTRRDGLLKEEVGQKRRLECNHVLMDADCAEPGPAGESSEKLSCSGALEVNK